MFEIEAAGSAARTAASSQGTHSTHAGRLVRRHGPSLEFLTRRPTDPSGAAPLLLLHGAFTGAWCWEDTWLRELGESGRFSAAVSLRGHGDSEGRPALPWTGLPEFTDDLILAIRAMPAPPILVAHSIGGLIAQRLLDPIASEQVALRGLVLVGTLPPEGLAWIGARLGASIWIEAIAGGLGCDGTPGLGHTDAMFGTGIEPAIAAAYAARMGTGTILDLCLGSFTSLAQACFPLPVMPAWAAGLPALVLHGSEDRLVDQTGGSRTALYHGADFRSIAGAGHCPMLGPQAGAGVRALLRWLGERGI